MRLYTVKRLFRIGRNETVTNCNTLPHQEILGRMGTDN